MLAPATLSLYQTAIRWSYIVDHSYTASIEYLYSASNYGSIV